MSIDVRLNGRATTLECAPTDMLLDVLRDEGLTSVRETCRIGVCGACTVLVDGQPVSGCLMMAAQAEGREVTTVEGLGGADPVQRAFVDAPAPSSAAGARPASCSRPRTCSRTTPTPSDEEIAEALGGNLCRCGSYVKITEAVRSAGAAMRKERT